LVKKINLNSLYGAILNPGCRFYDNRIGQSTTLTGRAIAKHMDSFVNECIFGKYDHVGESIIYGDTDSVYFSAWPAIKADVEAGRMEWNNDICIQLYDNISDQVNESFPGFMEKAFHSPRAMGSVIRGGRELVASQGLFIKKKRYAVLIIDKEGKRLDTGGKPGKVKAMGLDLKRSDTPKVVQDFLSEILVDVLTGAERLSVIDKVREFKLAFQSRPAWEKGTPKRVNNLTKYTAAEKDQGKANMPGHVRAAMNWNSLRRMHSDNYSLQIVDGMKTVVCKLRDNPLGFTSVGYPTDETHIPQWFKDLPFDDNLMEAGIVDQKVENLLGVLEWKISENTDINSTFDTLFSFE
jgi:DNA polymerase elongation subunit (family B)